MAEQPIITRATVMRMIGLLDWLYRVGVRQARELDDEGLAREFLLSHEQVGVYGFLSDGYNVGELEWQLRMMKEARLTSMYGSMYKYFQRMGRYSSNWLSCFLPVSQLWFNMGVRDYLDNPNEATWEVFAGKTRMRWTKKGLLSIKQKEYVETIQLQCFELQRKHAAYIEEHSEDGKARRKALARSCWDRYIRAVGLALLPRME